MSEKVDIKDYIRLKIEYTKLHGLFSGVIQGVKLNDIPKELSQSLDNINSQINQLYQKVIEQDKIQ